MLVQLRVQVVDHLVLRFNEFLQFVRRVVDELSLFFNLENFVMMDEFGKRVLKVDPGYIRIVSGDLVIEV